MSSKDGFKSSPGKLSSSSSNTYDHGVQHNLSARTHASSSDWRANRVRLGVPSAQSSEYALPGLSTNYSSRLIRSGGIFVTSRSRFKVDMGPWHELPEDILLKIFGDLAVYDLGSAARVCKHWNNVASSDYLWKKLFQTKFKLDPSIPMYTRAEKGWRGEYVRLVDEAPVMRCEVLKDHRSYVLHAAFSNSGLFFATCSFDAQVIVWTSDYPCRMVYQADLQRKYNWKFACYSQFNSSDTLLMVSGAYFGTGPFLTSGEVVIFDLEDDFRLLSRTKNRPYDLYGAWITDEYLVTGELKWLQNMHSTSTLLLIRSTQEVGSEHVPILSTLLKLFNKNSACARSLQVAYAPESGPPAEKKKITASKEPTGSGNIVYRPEYFTAEQQQWQTECEAEAAGDEAGLEKPLPLPQSLDNCQERLLIFTTGDKTFTPHQIGVIKVRPEMPERVEVQHDIQELLRRQKNIRRLVQEQPDVDIAQYESVQQLCHPIDHTIELDGNAVGMALSPDHRFLYVNSHPWPNGLPHYRPVTPVSAPSIAQHVNTHVFDLATFTEVGSLVQLDADYISSDESYYIFPSVSHHYFASGGSKFGQLWDRHYGFCLARLTHDDAVSCAVLSAVRPDICITVSDDKTVKIWRSRRAVRKHRIARAKPAEILLPSAH
ncbi:F-box/WD repeat-containing protein 5 [Hyalella azteca]|uniref:F-box/WD repeat-containing protein 5 n=1 Tax=Hyalella azteca TaxID=294128 RepID=A0A8B7NVE7_HYAAZ|nr:F-box/WD repeat-containing protein 5 [Hyalella azteca]